MTLEERAKSIADFYGLIPDTRHRREFQAFALRMLREAVDEARSKSSNDFPPHRQWTGAE